MTQNLVRLSHLRLENPSPLFTLYPSHQSTYHSRSKVLWLCAISANAQRYGARNCGYARMERFRMRSGECAPGRFNMRSGFPCAARRRWILWCVDCSLFRFLPVFYASFILQILINFTFVKFAFSLFQDQIAACRTNLHLLVLRSWPRWVLRCLLWHVNCSFLSCVVVFYAGVKRRTKNAECPVCLRLVSRVFACG